MTGHICNTQLKIQWRAFLRIVYKHSEELFGLEIPAVFFSYNMNYFSCKEKELYEKATCAFFTIL